MRKVFRCWRESCSNCCQTYLSFYVSLVRSLAQFLLLPPTVASGLKSFLIPIFVLLSPSFVLAEDLEGLEAKYDYQLFNATVDRLENGVPIILKQRDHSKSVYVRAVYDVGFMNFPCEQQQIPHVLEHMLFQGIESMDEQALRKIFRKFGGKAVGFTYRSLTYYQFEVHRDHLTEALTIFRQMLTASLMTKEDFVRSQEIVRTERGISTSSLKRMFGGDEHTLFDINVNRLYEGTTLDCRVKPSPYDISYEQVIKAYDDYYHPNNLSLIVVGDINTGEVKGLLNEEFGGLKGQGKPMIEAPQRTVASTEPISRNHKFSSTSTKVYFSMALPGFEDPDFTAIQLISTYLDEALYNQVRINHAFGYTPRSRIYADERRGFLVAEVKTTPKNLDRTIDLFKAEFAKVAQEGIPKAKFETSKRQFYLRRQTTEMTNKKVADQYMYHKQWAQEHGYMKPMTRAIDELTREEVLRVARKHYSQEPAIAYSKPLSLAIMALYFAGIMLVAILARKFVTALRSRG